jgi:hypothetical protein
MENSPRPIELRVRANGGVGYVTLPSRKRFAIALAVAAASDVLSFWTEFAPPVQWTLDVVTASLLFLVLGRRWEILPGLVAEAIPGLAAFPVWVLVVLAIYVHKK